MRTLAIAGLLAVTTAVLVLGVIVAVDRSAPSIGGVALDAQAEDPGEPDCDALADRALIGLLDYMEQVVDPVTALPAVDPPLELAAEDLPPGCDPVEVRRITYERLLPAAVERFGEEGLAARTTVLSAITIALNAEEFGLGPTEPRPITTRPATEPALQATPIPTEGQAATWCGQAGLVGAVVSTAGTLDALCADGSRVPISAAGGWESVDTGGTRLVAARRDPATGEPTITEYALAGGAEFGTAPGSSPAVSADGRLAWIQPDGSIAVDGLDSGPLTAPAAVDQVSWDRDGRWLFALTAAEPRTVMAFDTATEPAAPTAVAVDDVVAMAGEVDTPGNVVVLVTDEGTVRLRAAFVGRESTAMPFDLARTELPTATFGRGSFIEPLGLRRFDPDAGASTWAQGSTIGWVVGDGTSAHYVNGTRTTRIADDIRALAAIP